MLDLYKNIKKYRNQNEMSQLELARKTGYNDRSSIAKIESGVVDLPLEKVELFAKALGVSSAVLLGWEEEASSATVFTPLQRQLLLLIEQLNDEGQRRVLDYAADLVASGRYAVDTGNDKLDLPKSV